jgi:phosphatidylethanolamine/phosphatidyl-N-methylethanolamine N-methyltransferase
VNATQSSAARLFVNEACIDFGAIGAVAPSSPSLARAMTEPVDRCGSLRAVLEVGAGTGAVTAALMDRLGSDDRLDIVESNDSFADALRVVAETPASSTRPRTTVHNVRIEAFDTDVRYDVIVSGLPFTNATPDQVRAILDRYDVLLADGGIIVYFAYVGTRRMRSVTASRNDAHRHVAVEKLLSDYRTRFDTSVHTVWCNLPPARVWDLRRPRTHHVTPLSSSHEEQP